MDERVPPAWVADALARIEAACEQERERLGASDFDVRSVTLQLSLYGRGASMAQERLEVDLRAPIQPGQLAAHLAKRLRDRVSLDGLVLIRFSIATVMADGVAAP